MLSTPFTPHQSKSANLARYVLSTSPKLLKFLKNPKKLNFLKNLRKP